MYEVYFVYDTSICSFQYTSVLRSIRRVYSYSHLIRGICTFSNMIYDTSGADLPYHPQAPRGCHQLNSYDTTAVYTGIYGYSSTTAAEVSDSKQLQQYRRVDIEPVRAQSLAFVVFHRSVQPMALRAGELAWFGRETYTPRRERGRRERAVHESTNREKTNIKPMSILSICFES